jgi:hypothetical protein
MANVFISYRRSDSAAIAGRIRDRLADYYGADAIFIDIDSIPVGIDFRQQIQEAITKNDLVLAVIGPKWIGSKKAGATRISDYEDPIRLEIETALNHGIPLIPVVVGGATMPKDSALPDSLQKLCFLNAAEVDDGRDFHQHVDRLIRAMDRLLTESKLASLGQKSVSRPVTDVTASSRSLDDATPKEQLEEDRSVQDTWDPRKNAEFSSFFCQQTTASARAALLIGLFSLTLVGAAEDLAYEMQVPAMERVTRGLIAIPFVFAVFAATYSSLAQRYWQTFLLALSIINALVIFGSAWLSYKNAQSIDLEKWCIYAIIANCLMPLRFFNATGYSVFSVGMVYLFLVLTDQPLQSTMWMQAGVAVALLIYCAVAYFREQQLWLLFQSRGYEQRHDRA